MLTVTLLVISNTFMTFAWYGHLKHRSGAAQRGDRLQLADSLRRILLSGPGQPNRLRSFHRLSAQDHPGMYYAADLRDLCVFLPGRVPAMELCAIVRLRGWRCALRLLGTLLAASAYFVAARGFTFKSAEPGGSRKASAVHRHRAVAYARRSADSGERPAKVAPAPWAAPRNRRERPQSAVTRDRARQRRHATAIVPGELRIEVRDVDRHVAGARTCAAKSTRLRVRISHGRTTPFHRIDPASAIAAKPPPARRLCPRHRPADVASAPVITTSSKITKGQPCATSPPTKIAVYEASLD